MMARYASIQRALRKAWSMCFSVSAGARRNGKVRALGKLVVAAEHIAARGGPSVGFRASEGG